jgi:hypothetical protein
MASVWICYLVTVLMHVNERAGAPLQALHDQLQGEQVMTKALHYRVCGGHHGRLRGPAKTARQP